MELRICPKCGLAKAPHDYYSRGGKRRGYMSHCRTCHNEAGRLRQAANPLAHRQRNVTYKKRIRAQVLDAYGGQCACCSETISEFLALDHINGGGGKHRRESCSNTSTGVYREAIRLGFPADRFRLLCHNCNQALAWYGYCPHVSTRTQEAA